MVEKALVLVGESVAVGISAAVIPYVSARTAAKKAVSDIKKLPADQINEDTVKAIVKKYNASAKIVSSLLVSGIAVGSLALAANILDSLDPETTTDSSDSDSSFI